MLPITTIVSGGQIGANRAALDGAIAHGIPHGGLLRALMGSTGERVVPPQ